jgi:hypothetical protein
VAFPCNGVSFETHRDTSTGLSSGSSLLRRQFGEGGRQRKRKERKRKRERCIFVITIEGVQEMPHEKMHFELEAHTCNPSYSGGRDQEDHGSKPTWANSSQDPVSKKHNTKERGWQMAQGVGPKFKLEYHKKKKKKKERFCTLDFKLGTLSKHRGALSELPFLTWPKTDGPKGTQSS